MVSELKIVLASSSPRRISLLRELGLGFIHRHPKDVENNTILDPIKRVEYNSLKKAKSLLELHDNSLIIGADTVVSIEGRIMGKPVNEADAKRMIMELSGKCNKVFTGVTIVNSITGESLTRHAVTKVWFKKLSEKDINDYVASGEPLDKAGAYGIQGKGRELIDRYDGAYSNVVGFPLELFSEMLNEFESTEQYKIY